MFTIETYHGQYNRTARSSKPTYIVVHYTGSGTSAAGNAKNNCIYFSGGNRNASAHYFIDDAHIFEYADPEKWACWHVGDGKGRYGITNANSIGIEVCNNGGAYTEAEIERLSWLVQELMSRFFINADHVVRHYDASRKLCPLYYAEHQDAWNALHARITGRQVEDMTPEEFWSYDINGVQARDRLQGTDEAANAARAEVTRTDDPSGRNVISTTHDHLKWMAAKQAAMDEKLGKILAWINEG